MSHSKKIIIGRFGAPFGVKGWVKIISQTRPASNIEHYHNWQMKDKHGWLPIKLECIKQQHQSYVAKIKDIDDRNGAANLTNRDIAIEREQLPELEPDEFYWSDLIGLRVQCADGTELGTVTELMETGSNDVLVVQSTERRRLIPYTDHVIQKITLDTGIITVNWEPDF